MSELHHDHAEHNELAHVLPAKTLLAVFVALSCLTGATVAVAQWDFGEYDLTIALVIATIKATLVALYFMHLRYDKKLNGIIFAASLLFVILFIGIAVMDSGNYQDSLKKNVDKVSRFR